MTPREWSMFDRCYSGLLKANYCGKKVRFLTLTSSNVAVDGLDVNGRLRLIKQNFDLLRKRYERDFGKKFGDYFRVATDELYGTLHVLYIGSYIPHSWLVDNWYEIHGSFIIDIREPRGDSFNGAMYVIGQYVANQDGRKIFGYSRDWLYGGFSTDMKVLKRLCRDSWSLPLFVNRFGEPLYRIDYGKFKRLRDLWIKNKVLDHNWSRPEDIPFEVLDNV